MSKRKGLSTIVDEKDYERVRDIAESLDLTISMMVKLAVTDFCHKHGYEDIDLAEDVGSWGGKREGSGRPPHNEKKD